MKKKWGKKAGLTFIAVFLLLYMLLIFGPAELFFANVAEFKFVYGEFGGYLVLLAIVLSVGISLLLSFLPNKVHSFLVSIFFGCSVAGYLQVMFLNKNLDLLGLNPDGYQVGNARMIINLIIWLVVIAGVIVLAYCKEKVWKKVVVYLSAFLLSIQVVALVSLLVTAQKEAYERPEGTWHLSGEEQYTVSAEQNVIVIILDYFSNQYLKPLEEAYPGATEFLHDFTYYSNTDCNIFGTFPSLPHILTGRDLDMSLSVNDWCASIWKDENTTAFYDMLKEKDYKTNVYTPDTNILCGLYDARIMDGKIDNVVDSAQEVDVNNKLLLKTMFKMSGYRMFPEILKPTFYANLDEYSDVVIAKENSINHNNYDFYQGLLDKGLTTDASSNYYIVQHLMGPHLYTTDENGYYKENSTLEETAKGCMVIVEEYLNQLKKLDVYDNSTIIITADHGGGYDSQVIFYIKEAGQSGESTKITNAPISLSELLPTIAMSVGSDPSKFGKTIHDFSENELRERTYWFRMYDDKYPVVPCYTGDKDGADNVFYGYTYTGDIEDLLRQTELGPSVIIPAVDSYF